jgi:putative Mn2+ efflux pump MntP
MSHITYIRNIFSFALVGCVTFGAFFGFWIKGPELDFFRIIGAIIFVIIGAVFFQDILHEKVNENHKK